MKKKYVVVAGSVLTEGRVVVEIGGELELTDQEAVGLLENGTIELQKAVPKKDSKPTHKYEDDTK